MKNLITALALILISVNTLQAQRIGAIRNNGLAQPGLKNNLFTAYALPQSIANRPKLNNSVTVDLVRVPKSTKNVFNNDISRSGKTVEKGDKICKTEYRRLNVTNLNQDILNPDDINSLRLGGVYDISEFKKGNYNIIKENRKPLAINITGIESVQITNPEENALADGLTKLLNKPFVVRPAGFGQFLDCKIVNTSTELQLAAGVSYSGCAFDVASTFNYDKKSTRNKFLVTYINPVFTTQVSSGNKYFENEEMNNNPNLVVINRMTYGAKLLVYFESELDEKDIKATFTGKGWGAKADMSAQEKKLFNEITYKVFLYGESQAVEIVKGYDNLIPAVQNMINKITDKNKKYPIELGSPISYSLCYMNGDVAATNCNANELASEICTYNPRSLNMDLTVSLQSLTLKGGNNFGWIDFEVLNANHDRRGDDIKTVWNVNRDNATYQSIGDIGSPVANVIFSSINADDREKGFLRIWTRLQNRDARVNGHDAFLVKLDNPNYDEGLNGIHGEYKGQFYDIPLSQIFNVKPGTKYTEKLIRKSGNDKEIDIEINAAFK